MSLKIRKLQSLISENGLFTDGDWVESKDQDPNGEVRLIQLADIGTGEFIDKSNRFMTMEKAKALRCTILEPGDILIARMPDPIGRACIFPGSNMPCVTVVDVCIVRPLSSDVDSRWLMHTINSKKFNNNILNFVTGTTRQRISRGNLAKLEVPFPPITEQKRIAAILDKADNLRRKNQQAIQLADQFLRAVFLDMFGDPVTNPKGWEVKYLKDQMAHANNGLSRRRKETENKGEIVLRLQDVHYDGIRFEKDLNRIKLDEKEASRYKVDIGDILFIRVNGNPNYVGRSAVFKGYSEPVFHNDHLIRIKVSDAYNSEFLSYCFNYKGSRKIISTQIKTSAGQYTISQEGIERLEFFRPPIELQNKFIVLKNHILNIPHRRIDVNVLFNSLSQKAFAGEL